MLFKSSYQVRQWKIYLTIDSEVYCVLSVACGESGVFTDVSGLIRKAERGEGDGGVFEIWCPSPHCTILENDAVPVRRGHGHTQRRICNCHILFSAVYKFLPCYLEEEGWRKQNQITGLNNKINKRNNILHQLITTDACNMVNDTTSFIPLLNSTVFICYVINDQSMFLAGISPPQNIYICGMRWIAA